MPAIRKLVRNEEEVVEAYKNGQTLRNLADFYDVSHGTIKNILERRGVPLRARGRKRKERENPALTGVDFPQRSDGDPLPVTFGGTDEAI